MKKQVLLFGLFCIFITLFSCEGSSGRSRNVVIYENDGSDQEIVLENQNLELRFFSKTTEIVLTNKKDGSVWRSNPIGIDPLADTVTKYSMRSLFSLEYADVSGVGQTLYSSEQSVNLGAYSYNVNGNILEVNYTIGNLERTYIIPPAIPEERMLVFLDSADPDNKGFLLSCYRLYDINNLRESDNKADLLQMYPDLSRKKIYALRQGIQEYQKEEAEGILAEAGYTYDDYLDDIEHYPAVSGSEKPAFNLTFRYILEGNTLILDIPFNRIAYRPSYHFTKFNLMPYMGAGGVKDEGYLLVPDGSGSLIYFNNGRQNQNIYNDLIYGWDEGIVRDAVINDNRAPFPAFGIQKNGSAMLCIIENGASYASVRADVSGRNSSYNNVFTRFDMIHSAKMDITSRSEREIYLYERGLPGDGSITLRYVFCEEDSYVGMANEYRSWLLQKNPFLKKINVNEVPIAVEIAGAVNKTQHRLGIPFDLPLKLTSFEEMKSMVNDFSDFGWKNVRIKLNGWFNRSVDHSIPTRVKIISKLGSKKDFDDILTAAKKNDYNVYPEVDFVFMKDKKYFDGFSLYSDASRYVNRKRIQKYPYSFVWFGERKYWGKLSFIARPEKMMNMIDGFVKKSSALGMNNIAFRSISSKLVGDYSEKRHVNREDSMMMRQDKLAQLKDSGTGVMLLAGYAYAAPYADFIVDMALDGQGFGITDVSVPFYPIVLHGIIPYTGKAINLAEDYTLNLLKTIECGAGLYFSFIKEESSILQETKFRQFYANEYDKWVQDADYLYRKFSSDFGNLYNQGIKDHKILSHGVTVTIYEDGTSVIVNTGSVQYNYLDVTGKEITVNPSDYKVLRQGKI